MAAEAAVVGEAKAASFAITAAVMVAGAEARLVAEERPEPVAEVVGDPLPFSSTQQMLSSAATL
jgi:hypothetical protein